jgi:hypothetical protein
MLLSLESGHLDVIRLDPEIYLEFGANPAVPCAVAGVTCTASNI